MPIRFDQPQYLWLLLLAGPVVWLAMRYVRTLTPARRNVAIALRLLALVMVVLALAGLEAVRHHSDLTVIAVVDDSESMARFAPRPALQGQDQTTATSLSDWTRAWLGKASDDKRVDDRLGLVTFDDRPTVQAMPAAAGVMDTGIVPQAREGSRAGAAVRLAMAMLPADTARRLVLVSDGNDTAELDLLAAARQAASAGVPIDVLPMSYELDREVMVLGLHAPSQARQGQTAAVRVVLGATHRASGQLYLLRNGQPVDLNGEASGTGAPVAERDWSPSSEDAQAGGYTLVKLIDLPLLEAGAMRFEAVFEPASEQDAVTTNNRSSAFTLVRGQGQVLVLSHEPKAETSRFTDALNAHGIETLTMPASALPGDLAALSRFDAVVMQNVPAEMMDESQQNLLTQYVSDLGGGLVMLGGPDSYGAGGWTNSSLSRILPMELELPAKLVLPTGALVIVMDRSGSMSAPVDGGQNQQQVAAEAAVLAIATLYPQDQVGVVAFDFAADWIVPLGFNRNRRDVMDKVRAIEPNGGTNIYAGLELAYNELSLLDVQDAAVKHIILLTDGQSNDGPYADLLERMRQRNITLSTIGVGGGVNGELLKLLAEQGRGKYYPVMNPKQLPQVFIKEARAIRRNLIRERPFVPKLVASGSPVVAGLREIPALEGLVLTQRKADPRVFNALVGMEDEPVLAHWQVGLGQVAAFTSDATTRWGTRWVDWSGYGDFWSRLVRQMSRPGSSRDLELSSVFEDDQLVLRLEATRSGQSQAEGAFSQLATAQAAVVMPDGQRKLLTLQQTGPGLYEGRVQAGESGSYLVSVLGTDTQGGRQFVSGGANRPPGLELRRFASNRALLEEVAQLTGGRVLEADSTRVTGLFTRDGKVESSRSIRPLWRLLVWLLLVVFLLDVAARRLTWDPAALRAWLGLRQATAGDASAKLAAKKRKQTAAGGPAMATAAVGASGNVEREVDLPPVPVGKATAARETVKTPEKPVEKRPANPAAGKPPPPTAKQDEPAAGGTSRLMDAKRRARQKMEEQ